MAGVIVLTGCSSSTANLVTVSADQAATVIAGTPGVVVLDIRTPEEFADGFIAGAVNIDFYEPNFAQQIDLLPKDTPYVVYCRSGNRSSQAMETFADLGFTDVTEIDGGIVSWVGSGLPLAVE
jgi:rhodanese-related sulfurtransferase